MVDLTLEMLPRKSTDVKEGCMKRKLYDHFTNVVV